MSIILKSMKKTALGNLGNHFQANYFFSWLFTQLSFSEIVLNLEEQFMPNNSYTLF